MRYRLSYLALALCLTGSLNAAETPQVAVTGGRISGLQVEQGGQSLRVFKGVPFAAPPVGELRWRPPQPVVPWTEVRACREYAAACPQPAAGNFVETYKQQSEDCLYLNVWTAARDATERRPVMVWIHGGGNLVGGAGNAIYDGSHFARSGVVLVSIQYRLGAFGYLAHPALTEEAQRLDGRTASGNYGLMDQIAALKWVQDNIAAFGGDPTRVTIFGESAGAANVTHLMASSLSKGLFHRAIAQSGYFGENTKSLKESAGRRSDAEENGRNFAKQFGFTASDPTSLTKLRELTPEQILAIPMTIGGMGRGKDAFRFAPIVDGYVHSEDPEVVWASGRMHPVPFIAGSNLDDGSVFSSGNPIRRLQGYHLVMRTIFGADASRAEELIPAQNDDDVAGAAHRLITLMSFRAPARRLVRWAAAGGQPAWLYHFSHDPKTPRSRRIGVFHGLEIIYAFGTGADLLPAGDAKLSADMQQRWVNFAAVGDPNGKAGDPVCKPVNPVWPTHHAASDEHLEFGDQVTVGKGLDAAICDLVDKVGERRQGRK